MTRVEKKRRRRRRILNIILILLFLVILWQVARRMDFFNIKDIVIKGNEILVEDVLLKDSKIARKVNIFDFSSHKEARIIGKNPYVEDIDIRRKFPNKIEIKIKEKQEVFKLPLGSFIAVLDQDFLVLDYREPIGEEADLTLLSGMKFTTPIEEANIGSQIIDLLESKKLKSFFTANSKVGILGDFLIVDVSNENDIRLVSSDNKNIEFGRVYEPEYRLKLLREILEYIENEEIVYEKILMNKGEDPIIVRGKEEG